MAKKSNARKFSAASNSIPDHQQQQPNGIPTSNPNDVLDREVSVPGKIIIN